MVIRLSGFSDHKKLLLLVSKVCGKCGELKSIDDFYKITKRGKPTVRPECKKCTCAYQKSKRVKNVRIERLKEGFRVCSSCKIEKPFSDFWKNSLDAYGIKHKCIECSKRDEKEEYHEPSSKRRELMERNKSNIRIAKMKYKYKQYGVTPEQVLEMHIKQNYKCLICGVEKELLYVDHCHETSKIRGLLCQHCNSGLGMFKDNEKLLYQAIDYLRNSREEVK
jgi:hypothetical protein